MKSGVFQNEKKQPCEGFKPSHGFSLHYSRRNAVSAEKEWLISAKNSVLCVTARYTSLSKTTFERITSLVIHLTQHGCIFSIRPPDKKHAPAPVLSFRFPRSGRPESPRLRHVPEKMRFRHGASLGRNDKCRKLGRAWFAE